MKTAKFLRDCDGFASSAKLFELSEPVEYDRPWGDDEPPAKTAKYVVVSAAIVPLTGPETYIFPADEEGKIVSWGELDGSYRGGLVHSTALENAGYTVV